MMHHHTVTLRGNQRNGEKTKNNWVLRFVIFGVPKGERRVNRCAETGFFFFFTILIWRRWCWCHTSFCSTLTLKPHHTQSITIWQFRQEQQTRNPVENWVDGQVFFGWRQKKKKCRFLFFFMHVVVECTGDGIYTKCWRASVGSYSRPKRKRIFLAPVWYRLLNSKRQRLIYKRRSSSSHYISAFISLHVHAAMCK
jgi:hypothetical protein